MKQKVNPAVLVSLLAGAVIVLGLILYRAMTAPSASPVTSTPSAGGKTGKGVPNPKEEAHGPNADELKKMREYLQAHPEAQSKYR